MTKITKHPFAKEMLEYAQDAQTTDEPWLLWEFDIKDNNSWLPIEYHPRWDTCMVYRRKPQTYMIGEIEVPLPLKVQPELYQEYFYVDYSIEYYVASHVWRGDEIDNFLFESGQVYLNKEDAKKVAEAILALIPK